MDSLILAELLVLLAVGTGGGIGTQLGATSVVHSQPLVWMYSSVAKKSVALGALWSVAMAPQSGTLGGPVAIIRQVQPPPPPTVAPPTAHPPSQ